MKPLLIGLTGSIGMGKSTTAQMFADFGIPVWDADAAVHRLYSEGGAAVDAISKIYPDAIQDKKVDRSRLKDWIAKDPGALSLIETVVHPLVAADRAKFIAAADSDIVLLDIPLLFETGADQWVDAVVVVSAPPDVQRARVMQRGTMTEIEFETILAKQMPDAEKRAKADYLICTVTLEDARRAVQSCVQEIRGRLDHARNRSGHGNDGV